MPPSIRKAMLSDSRRIWEIRNDPRNRPFMRNSEGIPWEQHAMWFDTCLKEGKGFFFVLEEHSEVAGYLRLDTRSDDELEVAIALDSSLQKKGFGSFFLAHTLQQFIDDLRPFRIIAQVKDDNIPSQRLFEKCGFRFQKSEKKYIIYIYEYRKSTTEKS